jgi:6-pyruvoyltetrahydropterin/6-carboxytetrahydropterin synthase
MPSFLIRARVDFTAAHQLRLLDGTLEPAHTHSWPVEVVVAATNLDAMDCVMDFHELHRRLRSIVGPWHGRSLNDVEPFSAGVNPSAERVAEAIARRLELPTGVSLTQVEIGEADGCFAVYRP